MQTKQFKALQQLRILGLIEGISYIVLLFISMPLKYVAKIPQAVMVNGWLHGVLFVLLGLSIINVWIKQKWPFKRAFIAGLVTLIPFGTFWFDKSLKQEQALLQ